MASELTIGEHLRYLLGRNTADDCPAWPPDVFACCASLLLKSGTYARVLKNWPPRRYRGSDREAWARAARRHGQEWRLRWAKNRTVPAGIRKLWRVLTDSEVAGMPVESLNHAVAPWEAAMQLLAFADEASEGVGGPLAPDGGASKADEHFLLYASELLGRDRPGSSVCEQVSASRLRVLPKMHTSQNGLTIRSFSLYLALCEAGDVRPKWVQPMVGLDQTNSLNLLVVPWPLQVQPVQFRPSEHLRGETANMPGRFGLFTCDHQKAASAPPSTALELVGGLWQAAQAKMGRVDAIILPECAIAPEEHAELREFALSRGSFLVSGLGAAPKAGRPGTNQVCLDLPLSDSLIQGKHHRWKLDAGQVSQYGLGSILDPEVEWWEHIGIGDREFYFACPSAEIVLSVLICEDLARPDPVGDLVRAVGPNLVIALLMDGPQLKERWAARYATVLADDPGCSVLSITSLGMSRLSRPRDGKSRARVVALWKDAKTGGPHEIEIDEGCEGVVLSVSLRRVEEWTADGRSDGRNALFPILSGIHCVRYSEGKVDHS